MKSATFKEARKEMVKVKIGSDKKKTFADDLRELTAANGIEAKRMEMNSIFSHFHEACCNVAQCGGSSAEVSFPKLKLIKNEMAEVLEYLRSEKGLAVIQKPGRDGELFYQFQVSW